jgi:hypothetical protein
VILGFVGIKLILHAMHEYHIGELPEITTVTSLLVIVLTLTVTVLASLAKVRRHPEVLATHDVTGHHHPQGEELEELRAIGRHPQPEPAEPLRPEEAPAEGDPNRRSGPRDKQ